MPTEDERAAEAYEEYRALVHAMQSGVIAEMRAGLNNSHEPKHLRVGVNSALVETSVLLGILIDQGLTTAAEYAERLRDAMRAEVERYEQRLTEHFGRPISLG